VTFARLRAADWVAMVAALALLFAMAADWYSTAQGEENRRLERLSERASPGPGGEVEREFNKRAAEQAELQERNAWQEDGGFDRLILAVLIAAVALALAAGFLRAADRRFEPPFTPSAAAAVAAAIGGALVAYRIVQEPGFDAANTVEPGVPLALVALGVLALAAVSALRNEERGEGARELTPPQREPVAR
jgi:hypothetical protein